MNEPHLLNSWKEISCYMGRGVRTVQRWEMNFGMPVHRPAGRSRSAVVAFAHELDSWLRERGIPAVAPAATDEIVKGLRSPMNDHRNRIAVMTSRTDRMVQLTGELASRYKQIQKQLVRAVELEERLRKAIENTRSLPQIPQPTAQGARVVPLRAR
jgi:hypothetical protein